MKGKLERLKAMGWRVEGASLVKVFEFRDFTEAFAFVSRVALLSEREGHHPDICVSYNRVRLSLTTHDAGGMTERDLEMAGKIEEVIP